MTAAPSAASAASAEPSAPRSERCRAYLMPGMRCQSPRGHAGPCTNAERDDDAEPGAELGAEPSAPRSEPGGVVTAAPLPIRAHDADVFTNPMPPVVAGNFGDRTMTTTYTFRATDGFTVTDEPVTADELREWADTLYNGDVAAMLADHDAVIVSPVPDSPMRRAMATGHALRLGHELIAHHETLDGQLWHVVRDCCDEPGLSHDAAPSVTGGAR